MLGVSDAVKQRRTIRGFKPDPVPNAIIREILEIARYAPSNCNTQPWHLTLVSGRGEAEAGAGPARPYCRRQYTGAGI